MLCQQQEVEPSPLSETLLSSNPPPVQQLPASWFGFFPQCLCGTMSPLVLQTEVEQFYQAATSEPRVRRRDTQFLQRNDQEDLKLLFHPTPASITRTDRMIIVNRLIVQFGEILRTVIQSPNIDIMTNFQIKGKCSQPNLKLTGELRVSFKLNICQIKFYSKCSINISADHTRTPSQYWSTCT